MQERDQTVRKKKRIFQINETEFNQKVVEESMKTNEELDRKETKDLWSKLRE